MTSNTYHITQLLLCLTTELLLSHVLIFVRMVLTITRRNPPKERLQNFEQQLPPDKFMRIHRSYIVAIDAIEYIEGNHLNIQEQKIPIGQTYKENLLIKLGKK